MIGTKLVTEKLQEGGYRDLLLDLYVDENKIEYQTNRYIKAIANYEEYFGEDDVEIYSTPGRSEIGGNHTDHQHGAELSSSVAFETIIGTILSGLYNEMQISAIEIAIIGQYAENVYFGKPCGLMDQMACSC